MANKEMYLFKDEIYCKIRELEIKFIAELSKKNTQINVNLTSFNEKVNSILESNKKMIESLTSQKYNFEKIEELESGKKFMNDILTSHKIKINNIYAEINKMKYRYEKMLSENIIIPGYVGPGCDLKNLGEFIIFSIKDIKKLKEENILLKKESRELKTKVDLIMRNMTNMAEFHSNKMKEFTDTKDNIIESLLDNKLKIINEKSNETNKNLINSQMELEKKIKEIGVELEKINDSKLDLNTLINNKFEEINKKEEEMNERLFSALKEVEEIQEMKKELNNQIKIIYSRVDKHDKNKYIRNQKKLKTGIIKENIPLFGDKNNIRNFGTMTKNNNPNVNNANNNAVTNDNSNKNERQSILNIHHKSKKDLNINFLNDKKIILKKNNFTKASKNIKLKEIIKNNNQEDEPPLINSLKNNNLLNSGKKIREKIFEKTITNFKIDKTNSKNENKKILFNLGIQNYIKNDGETIESKLKLTNIDFTKKTILSMSDDEELRRIKTNNDIKNAPDLKYKNNEKINALTRKNIQTISRNFNAVDCNIVNLNLVDVPNINEDNNFNSSSDTDTLLFKHIKQRKIKSVDSKRTIKPLTKLEKTNILFYSSKGLYRIKK